MMRGHSVRTDDFEALSAPESSSPLGPENPFNWRCFYFLSVRIQSILMNSFPFIISLGSIFKHLIHLQH